jgi:hypothetical protein
MVIDSILQPKVFNYIIMGLYCVNSFWWLYHGKYADCCYWLSALAITSTVTFGYNR